MAERRAPELGVRLTVAGSQGEADVICSLLHANGIRCTQRPLMYYGHTGIGGWHEILVARDQLDEARVLVQRPPE